MRAPRILVLAGEPEVYLARLRARFPALAVESCRSYEELEGALRAFRPSVVFAAKIGLPFPRATLFETKSLEWVQIASAGADHLLPLDPRITVTSASGIHDEILADYILCAILMWNLRFPQFFRQQLERTWKPSELAPTAGKTLAILGLGSIGTLAASKAKQMGMRVLGVKARPELASRGAADEIHGVEALPAVASQSDFLAVTLPLTSRTRGLIGENVLSAMKPGSVLVNLSRGTIVDEGALVKALREGPLRGAVMDVFAEEPLPATSDLWSLPNLVITPHTGDIEGWREMLADRFCDNLARYLAGQPLKNVVDPAREY